LSSSADRVSIPGTPHPNTPIPDFPPENITAVQIILDSSNPFVVQKRLTLETSAHGRQIEMTASINFF
jgi:hypothetical protein